MVVFDHSNSSTHLLLCVDLRQYTNQQANVLGVTWQCDNQPSDILSKTLSVADSSHMTVIDEEDRYRDPGPRSIYQLHL